MSVLPGFLARYVVVDGLRRFARDWASLPAWTSGVVVALIRAPRLLAQRVRRTCLTSFNLTESRAWTLRR